MIQVENTAEVAGIDISSLRDCYARAERAYHYFREEYLSRIGRIPVKECIGLAKVTNKISISDELWIRDEPSAKDISRRLQEILFFESLANFVESPIFGEGARVKLGEGLGTVQLPPLFGLRKMLPKNIYSFEDFMRVTSIDVGGANYRDLLRYPEINADEEYN